MHLALMHTKQTKLKQPLDSSLKNDFKVHKIRFLMCNSEQYGQKIFSVIEL